MVSFGKTKNKIWIILSAVIFLIFAGCIIAFAILDKPLPQGKEGPDADAVARKLMESVNISAWENTAAVSWDFGGRNQHLWDRERHFSRVEWDEYSVLVDLNTQRGVAYRRGERVAGEEEEDLVEKAYKRWVNDAFWLNSS